jgi:hypothetical protein
MERLTAEQAKLVHRAVRYYQMNGTVTASPEYKKCDAVLDMLFDRIYEKKKAEAAECDI